MIKHLICCFILVFSSSSFSCGEFEYVVQRHLDESTSLKKAPNSGEELITLVRARRGDGLLGDIKIDALNRDLARNQANNFPVFKDFGFPNVSRTNWSPYTSSMKKSSLFGRKVGHQIKLADGSWARVRVDWDPVNYAHYNIEMRVKAKDLEKWETINVMIRFPCHNGKNCSAEDIIKMVDLLSK